MASDRVRGNRYENIVILDTSAVLMLFEFSLDFDGELTRLLGRYRILVPQPVIHELEALSQRGAGKKNRNAKASLQVIKNYDHVDAVGETVDAALVNLARKINGCVVTTDQGLRRRLQKAGVSVIYLRGKQTLVLE